MTTLFRIAFMVALLAGGTLPAYAEDVSAVAASLPIEVTEVVSGGNWTQGENTGVFRAITITKHGGEVTQAYVRVQMLATDKAGNVLKVAKTIPVKEVEEKKLANAFLSMDVENDNELNLIITSYDSEKDQDISLLAKFDATGKYSIVTPPEEETPAETAPKAKE
ncbi:MAG: hypothetical protein P8Y67_13005 [Alphaproteobacteria bacterium]